MTTKEKKMKKERGRGNNLLMQGNHAMFHEKVEKEMSTIQMYIFFLILKNTINRPNAKLILYLPKKT